MPGTPQIAGLFGLEGKVAIVTGGGGAIGSGIAALFSQAGATVVVADLNLKTAQAVAEQLGDNAEAIAYDQSDPVSIDRLVGAVANRHGRLDVMINCAAAFGFSRFEELSADEFDRIAAVNLRGLTMCCKAAIVQMEPQGGGVIVNISSIAASRFVLYDNLPYTATKAGGNAVTRTLAREYAASGIRVNAVIPGAIQIETPDAAMAGFPIRGPLLEPGFIPLTGAPGEPRDIAAACLFLASDAGRYITGQLIAVDGGISVN